MIVMLKHDVEFMSMRSLSLQFSFFTFQVFNLQSRRAAAENREFNFSFIKGTVRHPNIKKKLVSLLKSGRSCFDWRQF